MIEFEWYIKRARIDLDLFFKVENINSDEELAEYCRSKSLSLPKNRYFKETTLDLPVEETVKNTQEIKPKRTRRKTSTQTEVESGLEEEVKKEKVVRKPRRNTRKKASEK